MSATEIFAVSDGKEPLTIGETRNAHRGAMHVWNQISRDYFNLEGFPFFDKDNQSKVWNADKTHQLSDSEKIVLLSTMDRAAVKNEDINKLIIAFREYGADHPNSSYIEQAGLIDAYVKNLDEFDFVAWNQTSVNGDLLFCDYRQDEDGEEICAVDTSKLWSIFDE